MKNKFFLAHLMSSLLIFCLIVSKNVKAQEFVDPTTLENSSEEVVRQNLGILDFIEGVLSQVPVIINRSKVLVENINQDSIENIIYGAMGEIGLIDPQQEANNTAISQESPYSNPESTVEASQMGQASDTQQSQIAQRLSQIIFSKQGQAVIARQNQILEESQEGAMLSQEALNQTHDVSKKVMNNQIVRADDISLVAEDARSAKASQDVLKAIATQNEYAAQMSAGISEQLTLLTEAQVYSGVQMKGLNTQLTVLNQREQNMQSYFAAHNLQLSEIDNNLEQQIDTDEYHRRIKTLQAQIGITKVYIPGLFGD